MRIDCKIAFDIHTTQRSLRASFCARSLLCQFSGQSSPSGEIGQRAPCQQAMADVLPQYQPASARDAESWLPSHHFKSYRLDDGSGTVLTHTRMSLLGGSDAALGRLLMTSDTPGVHRFTLTVASSKSSTATKIRVGVATSDGSRVCGVRPWDGQLFPRPSHVGDGDTWSNDPFSDGSPRYLFLPRVAVGREVEVCLDYTRRRLTFKLDGEGDVDSRVPKAQLPDGLRPWVQCAYEGDAVVLSRYSFTPEKSTHRPRAASPAPSLAPQTNAFASSFVVPEPDAVRDYDDDVQHVAEEAADDALAAAASGVAAAAAAIAASVPIAGSFSPAVGRSLHVAEPYQAWSRDTAARLTPRAQAAAKAAEGARGYKESPVGLVASAEAAAAQAEAAAARAERRADAAEAAERRKRASLGLPAALQPEAGAPAAGMPAAAASTSQRPASPRGSGGSLARCAAPTTGPGASPSKPLAARAPSPSSQRALEDVWEPESAASRSQVRAPSARRRPSFAPPPSDSQLTSPS